MAVDAVEASAGVDAAIEDGSADVAATEMHGSHLVPHSGGRVEFSGRACVREIHNVFLYRVLISRLLFKWSYTISSWYSVGVHMCVCVHVGGRKGEGERQIERERLVCVSVSVSVCVSVYVCVSVCLFVFACMSVVCISVCTYACSHA